MYRTAGAVVARLLHAAGVVLDPARLVRKLTLAQQLRTVERHGVGVAQLVVGALIVPVGNPLIARPGAGGLQARRFRRPAERQKYQSEHEHHPHWGHQPGASDQCVPTHRSADDICQSGAQKVRAARAIAVVGAAQIGGQRRRRDSDALLSVRHGGDGLGGGPAGGAAGGGGATVMVVGGPTGMVMPGATSTVGWMTVSDGGGAFGGGGGGAGTPA